VPLIHSPRFWPGDLDAWKRAEARNLWWTLRPELDRLVARADAALIAFLRASVTGYQGVSWGKDSGVCLHRAVELYRRTGLRLPVVWVRVQGRENPDCPAVRDAWLARFGDALDYHEIEVTAADTRAGRLTSQTGFDEAAARFGDRYVSGVRADESSKRAVSAQVHGVATARVCRPILGWSARDVFAYHTRHDLPLHPAYAMTLGGRLDRNRDVRVASLGGHRGVAHGRRAWEWAYYRAEMRALGFTGPG